MGSQEFFAERAITAFEEGWRARDCELRELGVIRRAAQRTRQCLIPGPVRRYPAIVVRGFEHLGEADGNAVLDQIDATPDVAWLVAHAGGRGSTKVRPSREDG